MRNNFLLAIDIGNTDATFGLFKNNNLIKKFRINANIDFFIENYNEFFNNNLTNIKIHDCILCSVNDEINKTIIDALKINYNISPCIFNYKMCGDMKILTNKPQDTGADRLANAYAIRKIKNMPAIVVDAGTAITIDIISKEGDFIGGLIMPGINMQLESLQNKTSKLPKIEISNVEIVIGNTTKNAMLSGVIRGIASAIDGLIEQSIKEIDDNPKLYATGGQCEFISKYMKHKFDCIEPNLTLIGLQQAYYDYI